MEKQREILKRILTNKLKKREQERKMERQQKRESLIEKNKIIQKFIEINNDNNLYHNKYKSGNIRRFNKNITFYEKKTNISLCLKNQNLIKERENNGTYYLSNNVGYIKTNIYDMSRKNEKNEPQHFCDNERNKEIVGSTDFFSTHNNKDRNLNKYTLSHNKYKKYSPNKDRDILREETVFIKNNLQEEKIDKLNRKSEELNVQENYNNTKEKSSINAFNDLKKNEDKNKNNIGTSTQNRLDDICNNKCNDKFNTEKNNDKSLLQVDKLDYKEINCYHTSNDNMKNENGNNFSCDYKYNRDIKKKDPQDNNYIGIHKNNNTQYNHNILPTNKDLLVFKTNQQSKHHTDILYNNNNEEKENGPHKNFNVNENIKNVIYEDNYNQCIKRKRNSPPTSYKTIIDRERSISKNTSNINNKSICIKNKSTICTSSNLVNLLKNNKENNIISKDKNYDTHIYNTIDNDKHVEKYNTNKKYCNNYMTNKTYNNIHNNINNNIIHNNNNINNNNNNYSTHQKYNLYYYTHYDRFYLKRRKTYANDNNQM
ncbi:hypothetical protein PFNF135_01028 [Plasmodium falciparum NF135/5.C10]|uniref:Uncharacterized protein n=1 Tax=Plasmodium falciparum NF135/5.C10 TaxID=1036726 RepID=W4ILC0_PLAFA|nr:hypothetical protein PFNF135_01028 [Plasmodium falciparum NF135/5.C10]